MSGSDISTLAELFKEMLTVSGCKYKNVNVVESSLNILCNVLQVLVLTKK